VYLSRLQTMRLSFEEICQGQYPWIPLAQHDNTLLRQGSNCQVTCASFEPCLRRETWQDGDSGCENEDKARVDARDGHNDDIQASRFHCCW
jgi:hypothetical protein